MSEFPSWVRMKGKVYTFYDKDITDINSATIWVDVCNYYGHSAIRKFFNIPAGEGEDGENFPCPKEIAQAILNGKLYRLMEAFRVKYSVNKKGQLHGVSWGWYPNGQKGWENTYQDGELIKAVEWYENGQKKWEDIYRNGKRVKSLTWYESGEKCWENTYRNGKLIKSLEWDEEGHLKEQLTERGS